MTTQQQLRAVLKAHNDEHGTNYNLRITRNSRISRAAVVSMNGHTGQQMYSEPDATVHPAVLKPFHKHVIDLAIQHLQEQS